MEIKYNQTNNNTREEKKSHPCISVIAKSDFTNVE
jgi:hypothetical protein